MTRRQNFLAGFAVLAMLLIGSLIFLSLGINWWRSGSQSNDWPRIDGQLVQISFVSSAGRRSTGTSVLVGYKYQMGGINYQGDNFRFGDSTADVPELRGWHVGDTIKISVNPKNPTESVLKPGVSSLAKGLTLFGGFTSSAVLLIAIVLGKTMRDE